MPPHRDAAAPSRSQTSSGKVTNIAGQTLIGANAKVDAAPARKAISALRQPQARMTGWARLNQFTAAMSLQLLDDRARPGRPSTRPVRPAGRRVRPPGPPACAPRPAPRSAPAPPDGKNARTFL